MTTSLFIRPPANRPTIRIVADAARPNAARTISLLEPTEKGWFNDPMGQHKFRFHDGLEWTEHTTHFGPVPCLGCR